MYLDSSASLAAFEVNGLEYAHSFCRIRLNRSAFPFVCGRYGRVRMLLSHHYRSSWEYTPGSIEDGRRIAESLSATGGRADVDAQAIRGEFFEALNNDLDTPTAIRALVRLADGAQRPEVNREYLDLASILGLRLAGDSVQA